MWSDDEFKVAVAKATSRTSVLRELGVCKSPARMQKVQDDLDRLACPTDHFRPSNKYTDEQIRQAASSAKSYSDVIRRLGIRIGSGGTFNHIQQRVVSLGLHTSFPSGKGWSRGKMIEGPQRKTPEQILVLRKGEEPKRHSHQLVRALKEVGVPYKCSECELEPVWKGKPLNLQVDHINGDNRDNRRENLRFLCPNCHTQTDTYGNKPRKITKGQ